MGRTWWSWARLLGGAAILAVLVRQLGTGPFLHGLRTVDAPTMAAATGIAAATTLCCAWRWTLVARGLGIAVPLREAVPAYYRSQFLNSTLPGGVLGDLHRGVLHGRGGGNVGLGLRAVGWERLAGQLVQAALAVLVLLALPSPVRTAMPAVLAGLAVAVVVVLVVAFGTPLVGGRSRWARIVRAAGGDLRTGLLARRAWPGIVAASAVVVVGHVATFLIAARAAGVAASTARLLPLALLILLAMTMPITVGGWGPREGAAAWAFGAAGLGAGAGVATAVVYGVLALVANLPGALVLAAELAGAGNRRPAPPRSPALARHPVGRHSVVRHEGG